MRDVIVAVDIETTGLDPINDRIIEIGAVKVRDGMVLDEWTQLVQPGCPIPAFITQLTGISAEDVAGAPPISRVLPELRRFIGSAPVIGHNVRFDLGFLTQAGLAPPASLIDTYTLASVMLPAAPRYSLSALAALLQVPVTDAHRALNDAHVTAGIYAILWEQVLALPLDTLAEIVRLGQRTPWDAGLAFEAALDERRGEVARPASPKAAGPGPAAGAPVSGLAPRTVTERIDAEAVAAQLAPGGPLSGVVPTYEDRPQQLDMLREVASAFNDGRHLLVEAPTGVGKSLAYLLPALHFAVRNQDRVVISTNTINLQEQLIERDIPLLQQVSGVPFRAAVLKGRSNYLCPRRLAALRRRGPTSAEEMHMLAKLLVWLTMDSSGDRSNLSLRGPAEMGIWARLSAEDEGCTMERCALQDGVCPFYQARQRAESAHLLIVNHALLLSDVVAEGHVLPEYRHLIVDEAHHLEDAVTSSMSFRTDPEMIRRQIADLGTLRSGLMGDLLRQTEGAIPPGYHETLRDYVDVIAQAAAAMAHHVDWFFQTLRQFLETHSRIQRNEYTQQVRIVSALRSQPGWSEVELRWDNLRQFTGGLAEGVTRLAQGLAELSEYEIEDYDDLLAAIGSAGRHLTALHMRLDEMVVKPDANTVYWVELSPDGVQMSVHAAPLEVGPLVQRHVWFSKETVVMTSATLRTDGTFDFIRGRLKAEDVDEVVIDTPFDYEKSTLLYLVDDIAEPSEGQAYQSGVERGILNLCRATGGRAMVLFTSYTHLRETVKAIGDALARDGIVVYDQSSGSSRSQLLEGFVQSEKSVLMGTRSFWEGVDVPGDDLSVLIIVRLPFSVPSDPLFAARSELFANPFTEYALPETVLRFRQGFGRLIRRASDRGVVAILDRRILSKQYGRMFLNSLPRCTVRQGRLADLPNAALDWLAPF